MSLACPLSNALRAPPSNRTRRLLLLPLYTSQATAEHRNSHRLLPPLLCDGVVRALRTLSGKLPPARQSAARWDAAALPRRVSVSADTTAAARPQVATTCLFLASKVEETPKKLRDVIVETYKVQHTTHQGPESDQDLSKLREQVLICERELLRVLGFDLSVEHAYRCVPLPPLVPHVPHVPPLLPRIPFAAMLRLSSPRSLVPTRSFVPRRVRACVRAHVRGRAWRASILDAAAGPFSPM